VIQDVLVPGLAIAAHTDYKRGLEKINKSVKTGKQNIMVLLYKKFLTLDNVKIC